MTECVDHDDDVAGMKEAVMVSHNQDTISAIHKIERSLQILREPWMHAFRYAHSYYMRWSNPPPRMRPVFIRI